MNLPGPSVSVVMAVYNGRQFLAEQISSVLSQLKLDDELIIVDDASNDDSLEIVRAFAAPNIRVVLNVTNAGVKQTFQRGLLLARHEIIFLCDQDDVWLPGKRDACVAEFAQDPEVLVVVTDAEIIDGYGNVLLASFVADRGGFNGSALGTLWRNRYLGGAMAIRSSLLSLALPIPEGAPMHDMWLGVIGYLCGAVVYLPKVYLRYRRHGANATPYRRQSLARMSAWRVRLMAAIVRRLVALPFGRYNRIVRRSTWI
jgi:glycosyltransferase involved in cell wall biosynthesis